MMGLACQLPPCLTGSLNQTIDVRLQSRADQQDRVRAKSFDNPRLRARRTKEIIPVVTTPIESEKGIFRFSCVFMVSLLVRMSRRDWWRLFDRG